MLTPDELSNPYVRATIDEVPRYGEAMAIADQAQQALASLPVVTPEPEHPLVAGNLDEAWISAVLSRNAELAHHEQKRRLLGELKREAEKTAEHAIIGATDEILSGLHTELESLLDKARRCAADLGDARTAAQAVDADAGPAWKKLTELADEYQTLRGAQEKVMLRCASQHWMRAENGDGEAHASDAFLKNLDELWPHWRLPQAGPQVVNLDGRQHRAEPWPADPVALLLWIVTSEAEAWVPTRQQLDELWEERRRKANPNPVIIREGVVINRTSPKKAVGRIARQIENRETATA